MSDALKERLESYGLKGNIEPFGAVKHYFVENGVTDYEYLMQNAKKYGKTVYAYEDTVYIQDEVTISEAEVILEWGKSLISFRCSENLKGQLSSCTFVGWDENNCEGITGSAGFSDIPVKVGGDSSWEDNSKGASGTWKAVFTADDLYDNEDAKKRAIGCLQNISMEYQTGVGKCEGNRYIFPGMRVTIKYVGEHFSGEYIAERVVHEVSVNGPFTTEVYVKRNMTAGGASHVPGAELGLQSRKVRAIRRLGRQRGKKEMNAQPCMRRKQMIRWRQVKKQYTARLLLLMRKTRQKKNYCMVLERLTVTIGVGHNRMISGQIIFYLMRKMKKI